MIFVGLRWFAVEAFEFAALNLVLALGWLVLAVLIGRRYAELAKTRVMNIAPRVRHSIPDMVLPPGDVVHCYVDLDTFEDTDPGDVLALSARQADGQPLPAWLLFDPERRRFAGVVPEQPGHAWQIEVTANDVDGSEVSCRFVIRCDPAA